MEQLTFNLDREYLVVQGNDFIAAHYDMTAMEQKLMLILISTIQKNTKEFNMTTFKVKDLADIMEIQPETLYRDLPKICKSIIKKIVEIKNDNGDWHMFNIISYAAYRKQQGIINIEINSRAKPYLLQLKTLFSSFELGHALNLESKYSIRLYQIAKSNLYKGEVIFDLQEFKNILALNKKSYDRYNNITLKVLNPAMEEITNKTDISVTYKTILSGRKAIGIKFNISRKKITKTKVKERIDPKSFNNFEAREYDYEELEKKLLAHYRGGIK